MKLDTIGMITSAAIAISYVAYLFSLGIQFR
jgi:hypothetical protein